MSKSKESEPHTLAKQDFFGTSMKSLREDIDGMFSRFFKDNGFQAWAERISFPAVDVIDNKTKVKVKAEIAGMEADDVDVSVEGNMLVIKGEKKQEKEDKGDNYLRQETTYGSFLRTIPLPETADEGKASAQFKNGVLTVEFPKKKGGEHKAKKIEVKKA